MSEDTRPPPSNDAPDDIRAAVARFFGPLREAIEQTERDLQTRIKRAAALAERPPGWAGHWSARYGQVLARTLNLEPPFTRSQSEMLGAIPRPLREALDPVASVAEPVDRDGKLVAWRLARSAILDLFGPIGLVLGALALAIVAFTIAVPRLGLPPLMAPAAAPQPPQAQPQPPQHPTAPPQPRPPEARPQPQSSQLPPAQQKQQPGPPQAEAPLEQRGQNRQQGLPQPPDQPQQRQQQQQQQQNQAPVAAPPRQQQSPKPPASPPADAQPRSGGGRP
jgi:hypothetical protein